MSDAEARTTPRPFVWTSPETLAAALPAWAKDHADRIAACERFHPSVAIQAAAILALGRVPTVAEARVIFGHGGWTATACDHCGVENVAIVSLGQEPDYESHTADVCAGCLRAALETTP